MNRKKPHFGYDESQANPSNNVNYKRTYFLMLVLICSLWLNTPKISEAATENSASNNATIEFNQRIVDPPNNPNAPGGETSNNEEANQLSDNKEQTLPKLGIVYSYDLLFWGIGVVLIVLILIKNRNRRNKYDEKINGL